MTSVAALQLAWKGRDCLVRAAILNGDEVVIKAFTKQNSYRFLGWSKLSGQYATEQQDHRIIES